MRRATLTRETRETSIAIALDLDGTGTSEISTGIGFLDHMLTLLARHAMIDVTLKAAGDLEVDDHHTAEDAGIVFGQAFAKALGGKAGIRRYADCHMPMDEALTRVALDISGRPHLTFKVSFPSAKIGNFDSELVREWFQAFASQAAVTLHVETLSGVNGHHIAESCFKGLARVIRRAAEIDPRLQGQVPSTKGTLSV